MMYQFFKRFFNDQIEQDYDLKLWIQAKSFVGTKEQEAYQRGQNDMKAHLDTLINQKVLDRFAQQNWLVNPNHVFQVSTTGSPFLGLQPVTKDVARELQQQAKTLKTFLIWSVFQETVRQKAIEQALKTSTTWEHVLPGKMMLHNLQLLDSIVTAMENFDLDKIQDGAGKGV